MTSRPPGSLLSNCESYGGRGDDIEGKFGRGDDIEGKLGDVT